MTQNCLIRREMAKKNLAADGGFRWQLRRPRKHTSKLGFKNRHCCPPPLVKVKLPFKNQIDKKIEKSILFFMKHFEIKILILYSFTLEHIFIVSFFMTPQTCCFYYFPTDLTNFLIIIEIKNILTIIGTIISDGLVF